MTNIYNYQYQSVPEKVGGKYFFRKNEGLQDQAVFYMMKNPESESEVVLDPNLLSENGTVAVSIFEVSDDGKYLAYGLSKGGSDWVEIYVKDLETGENLDDHLKWVKFSEASWYKNGFYYSRYQAPQVGEELTNVNQFQMLYYHKTGTPQSEDELVFKNDEDPSKMYSAEVIDKHYLVIYESDWNSIGNALYIKDLTTENSPVVLISGNMNYQCSAVGTDHDQLFVITNENAPFYQLVSYDLNEQQALKPGILIPEQNEVMESACLAGGKLIVRYMKDVHSELEIFDLNGNHERMIALPGMGTVNEFSGSKNDSVAFYSYTSYIQPGTIYKYNIISGQTEKYFSPTVDFDMDQYVSELKFYKAKDGTDIPIYLVHKKGIRLDGKNPALLYGYGGFNVTYMPVFQPDMVVWLENGGIYANAHIRGGGEYGEDWHRAGMLLNKQTVFDDFIGAAEFLINEKYTSSSGLVARGGSNGGLLIGAVVNQRPDLFKVAFPAVGVMDMLRFHKFTIGSAWVAEYGSSEDSIHFGNLYSFSPLHNIKEDVDYPAVLVTTADHDDRVVPAHSFKYIATLQEKYKGNNPVLVRIETDAGHSAGKPTSKRIEEATDMWTFAFNNLNIIPYEN